MLAVIVIGALIIGPLGNSINLLNVNTFWQRTILIVVFDQCACAAFEVGAKV